MSIAFYFISLATIFSPAPSFVSANNTVTMLPPAFILSAGFTALYVAIHKFIVEKPEMARSSSFL